LLAEADGFGLGFFGFAKELALLFEEALDLGIGRG
jgi:hypothetical protein